MIHTLESIQVSMGKFIDTVLGKSFMIGGETELSQTNSRFQCYWKWLMSQHEPTLHI